jgi:predicted nucleic-acid-binding Zn-ribbon protein
MICPKCRNRQFTPTEDVKRPIKNLGHKEHYNTFNTRKYICLQCGYSFLTKEEFYREVKVMRNRDLFEELKK